MKVHLKQLCATTIVICFCLCLFPAKVSAYLDPGAGSSMLQLLLAGLLGALYATKLYWARIKSFLARRRKAKRQPE